jgi:hypothetical protein
MLWIYVMRVLKRGHISDKRHAENGWRSIPLGFLARLYIQPEGYRVNATSCSVTSREKRQHSHTSS